MKTMTEEKYYGVVTFGAPMKSLQAARGKAYRDKGRAIRMAEQCVGTGTCSSARVYECDTAALARSANISEIRPGERCVWQN